MEIQTNVIAQRRDFEALLLAQMDILKGMARHFARDQEEIEDLIQDTLLKALRFYGKFNMDTCIRKWLFTIIPYCGERGITYTCAPMIPKGGLH